MTDTSPIITRLVIIGALTVGLCATPGSARAQTEAELAKAKVHFQAGQTFFSKKMYGEALGHLQKAYKLAPTPALIFNIAVCHEELGNLKQALIHYQRYVVTLPFDDKRRQLQAKVDTMAQKVGHDTTAPDDSTATKPAPAPATDAHKTADTPAQDKDQSNPLKSKDITPKPGKDPVAEDDGRFYTWLAAGAAGAFGITALALGLSTNALHGSLKEDCGQTAVGCSDGEIDGVRSRAIATDVMIGLTAGAAVAAVVLYFVEGRSERAASNAGNSAWLVPTQGGATVGLSRSF